MARLRTAEDTVEAPEALGLEGSCNAIHESRVLGGVLEARRLQSRPHKAQRVRAQHGHCGGDHAATQEHGNGGFTLREGSGSNSNRAQASVCNSHNANLLLLEVRGSHFA